MANIRKQGPEWLEKLPQMPQLVFDALQQSALRNEQYSESQQRLAQLKVKAKQRTRRHLLIGATAILTVAMLLRPEWQLAVSQLPWYGWLLAGAGWVSLWRA